MSWWNPPIVLQGGSFLRQLMQLAELYAFCVGTYCSSEFHWASPIQIDGYSHLSGSCSW